MTDHLEPYRRMVRSIRFVPQLGRNQNCHHPGTQSVTPVSVVNPLPRQIRLEAPPSHTPEPVIDPSEHVASLVKEAVSKPTVLPISYVIQENIGDRISRMAPAKAVNPIIPPPKIPQPDPNWTSPPTAPVQLIELNWRDLLKKEDAENSAIAAESAPAEDTTPPSETATLLAEPVAETEAQTSTDEVAETPQEVSPAEPPSEAATVSPERLEVEADASTPETVAKEVVDTEETNLATPPASERSPEAEPVVADSPTVEQKSPPVETVPKSAEQKATVILEERAPIVEEKASDEKAEEQIQCPACHSTDLRKNGHRNDKQRYICKDCGKQFAAPEPVTPTVESSKSKQNSPVQLSAAKKPQSLPSVADSPATTSLSPGKNKKKPKGFGGKKAKK